MARRRPWLLALSLMALAACSGKQQLTISELSPTKGPFIGGDPVTITGSGFDSPRQAVKVYFGKKLAKPPIILSNTEMRVDPPGGEIGSTVDVEMYFDDARSVRIPQAYTYIDPLGAAMPDAGAK